MPFLLWQVLHSNSHAILVSSMSEKHSVPLGASGVTWRTPQMAQSHTETALHWKFICGIVVASITWSQTLLVFAIKPFSWGALFSSAPPGQQRWTLLGIIVKQGGSIKSTVVWLLDLDSLKIHPSGFFQPSYRLFSSEWEITSQTDVNTNNLYSPANGIVSNSEPSILYSTWTWQVKPKTSFHM